MKIFLLLLSVIYCLSSCKLTKTDDAFIIEKSVYNIFLQDERTTVNVLGANSWNQCFEADSMLPRIECLNKNQTEGLRLLFFYGGFKSAVAEFEIFSVEKDYKTPAKAVKLGNDHFKTGNNIMLGLAKQKVINILGKSFKSTKTDNQEEVKYYTDDSNSKVLKEYGAVAYFIVCKFINNKLVRYRFGFEYP